jgi:hypothetical protein
MSPYTSDTCILRMDLGSKQGRLPGTLDRIEKVDANTHHAPKSVVLTVSEPVRGQDNRGRPGPKRHRAVDRETTMQLPRPVGREAASRKYDILSALMAFALSQDKHVQRQVLRLMALITTRYNWQRDELTMGQGEIARLWSVDERTVKREMARLRAQGWLVLKRAGARGRVSVYGIDLNRMLEDTRPAWPLIGEDFITRLEPEAAGQGPSNVVPLRSLPVPVADGSVWAEAQAWLLVEDAVLYGAWLHALAQAGREANCLTLAAPTRFHATYVSTNLKERVLAALRRVDPSVREVRIVA